MKAKCNCGQLSIEISQPPVAQLICHCEDCRQVSGLDFTPIAFCLPNSCDVSGESTSITMAGGTGKSKSYHSCPECQTCLYASVEVLQGMIGVVADCVEAPFQFQPKFHVWTSEKAEPTIIRAGAMQFEQGPPAPPHRL